jgi:hypothetical protein
MTDLHDVLPPPARTNTTPLYDNHPDDHNVMVDAVNQLAAGVGTYVSTIMLKVYADIATRQIDEPPEGTLGWAVAEGNLAIYHSHTLGSGAVSSEWIVLRETMQDFTPRCWIGAAEQTYVPVTDDGTGQPYQSRFRQDFGYCFFSVQARFSGLTSGQSGDLAVMPPLQPTGLTTGGAVLSGPFSVAYVVVPTTGAIGGVGGAWNGSDVLTGSAHPGKLAIVMPGTQALLDRSEMGSGSGTFDVIMAGSYPLDGFVEE